MTIQRVALIGSPNCGKTNLYNWLTGSKFKTVNYPGSTVEYAKGKVLSEFGAEFQVIDTPGIYGLDPQSSDEQLTVKTISSPEFDIDGVLVVVDGTQLERHLLLASQIQAIGIPFVIVMTMKDLLEKNKIQINLDEISKAFGGIQVILFDGVLGAGLKEIVSSVAQLKIKDSKKWQNAWTPWGQDRKLSEIKRIHEVVDQALQGTSVQSVESVGSFTRKLDQWLLHPFFGFLFFIAIMTGLFSSIYWVAAPFMDFVDGGFSWLASQSQVHLSGHPLLASFVGDGVIAGLGSVFVFTPQIFILFFLIGFLESTGYLSRAATIIDKPFSLVGLSGRSFVPFLSGYSCAVPAIIAVRNISSFREKLISAFVIPLLTCSARLPVYALLLGFLFSGEPSWKAGFALAMLYIGAMLLAGIAAGILNRILPKDKKSYFMMELPLYRMPRLKIVFRQATERTISYIKKAGPIIFVVGALMWAGTKFPLSEDGSMQENIAHSYLGQVGVKIDPVFEHMGVDWRVGVGLASAFLAREVFVSTLAVIFNAQNEDEDTQQASLLTAMRAATNKDGLLIFTPATVCGLLVFFMIALQCVSTFAVFMKELGSPGIAVFQLFTLNLVAYILAIVVVQGLRIFGVT